MQNRIIVKEIALGGLFIAIFISLNYLFGINARVIQTYLEIPKTAIAALYCSRTTKSGRRTFFAACLLTSLVLLPIQVTAIYNIPCLIGGFVIGRSKRSLKSYLLYFICNTLFVVYEIYLHLILANQNLFSLYFADAASLFKEITGIEFTGQGPIVISLIFLIVDSAFSSAVIFFVSHFLMRRLDNTRLCQ